MGRRKIDFTGYIENGRLRIVNRDMLTDFIASQPEGQRMRIRVTRQKRSRSQNRYYWGVVVPLIANHTGYGSEELHDALKRMFLGRTVLDIGSKEVVCTRSSAALDTKEFAEYVDQIVAWAATELGVGIPAPGE